MTTEVGAGPSADGIHAVADPAWLARVRNEAGAEPVLDGDGAVVIRVSSGSGPILEGAPPDRTIRLPDLGAHQARVALTAGSSPLQRVVIDAHQRLEELTLDGTGPIGDLTVNAAQDGQALTITGQADVRTLRLRGGKFQLSPPLLRPTTVLDLRDTAVEAVGGQNLEPARFLLGGHVQLRGYCGASSSLLTSGTSIEMPNADRLLLGIVNPEQAAGDPPLEVTFRSPGPQGPFVCYYLPPATRVRLDTGSLQLQRPERPTAALAEDDPVARYWQAPPSVIERLTVIGAGHVQAWWDLESPTFTPQGGELTLHVPGPHSVFNASGRVTLGTVSDGALCQGSTHSPLVLAGVKEIGEGGELERLDLYDLSVGDVRRLQPAGRVTPWIPGPRAARERERAMRVGTDSPKLQAQRRADFWTKLAATLSAQQVLGSVQSNVRLASMRARRRALPWGRERFWLSAFALIGYGERIMLPLLVWLGGVVLAGLGYAAVVGVPSGVASPQFVELLGRLALGPLAILRVELRPPNVPGPWDTVIWVAAQVLGAVCLGSALVAIRKVTRAAQ
jgi:hypothetical protein